MLSIRIVCLIALIPLHLSGGIDRSTSWRPERVLGSDQVSLAELSRIVIPNEAGRALRLAVEDFEQVYANQVGGSLLIQEGSAGSRKRAITLQLHSQMSRDGSYRIHSDRSQIVVQAATEEGLTYALYALCEELLGARWYWSDDLGLEYVHAAPSRFSSQVWRAAPAFKHRQLYPTNTDYGRRNRLNSVYRFNHALARVFNKSHYYLDPEVFSVVNGRKREPKGHGGTDPQPNLAHPRAVEIAAEAAMLHFSENPNSRSYSLSINDNVLFDETELTQAQVTPLKYFRTRPDYTDYVFGFMNAVAKKVFDEGGMWETANGEDRYLSALSYFWTEPSPGIEIHPRVMPVLTSDRAQWHDSAYRAEDKMLIKEWSDSGAERLATWDYYFGAPYPYPRQFTEWIAESIPYLHEQGVDVFFSQLPAVWGLDGPKAWLAAKLLWNPYQDVDALLDEYYVNFFGAAGEPIRAFYEVAENHRNAEEGKADWIKFYKDEAGIGLFPLPLLEEMRGLIENAKKLTQADARRLSRVEIVSAAFRYTEAYAAYHTARSELLTATFQKSTTLPGRLFSYQESRREFNLISRQLVDKSAHSYFKYFSRQMQSEPEPLALAALAEMGLLTDDQDTFGLNAWVDESSRVQSVFSNIELLSNRKYMRNFLGPELPFVDGWHFDFRPAEHLSVANGADGSGGILLSGADVFSIFRDVTVSSQSTYLLNAKLRWQVSPDNRTQIKLIWRDPQGKHLLTQIPLQLPWGSSKGVQSIVLPVRAPKDATSVRIHFVASRQYAGDFLDLQSVDFGLLGQD